MGRCKSVGSLKSCLWYTPQLSGDSILYFRILSFLRAHRLPTWFTLEGYSRWHPLFAAMAGNTPFSRVSPLSAPRGLFQEASNPRVKPRERESLGSRRKKNKPILWRIYLQGSNGETDIENRLMGSGRGEERVRWMERITCKLTLLYVK